MGRKAITEITVSLGSVSGLALAAAPSWGGGSSVEADKIAAYGDPGFTSVPRAVKSYPEMTLTFLDQGDGKATACEALVGTVVSCSITPKFGDGKTTAANSTDATTFDVTVLDAAPGGDVAVDGERKATFTVKVVRHAPPAPAATNGQST